MYFPTPGGSRFERQQNDLGHELIEKAHLLKVELYRAADGSLIGTYHLEGQFESKDSYPRERIHALLDMIAHGRDQEPGGVS